MKLKLLQIGPPKCGNYWLYNIIQKIYHYKGIGYKSFIINQPVYGEAKNWELSHSLQTGKVLKIEQSVKFNKLKNIDPGHVKKGNLFQWFEIFTEDQKQLVLDMAGPLPNLLGYSEATDKPPADINRIDLEEVKKIAEGLKNSRVSKI